MTKPTLGRGCEIDVEKLVESRMLIQANSGGGKSWALRRLLEQTYSSVQQIVLDHDGEFHTLREKFDYVLAGKGGDCPADIKSAALLARRLLEMRVSAIIDIYELGTQRAEFVKRFVDSLVNAPRDLWHPLLVVVDEAHIYCPEAGSSVAADAIKSLMTLGRKRGFCGVLATQRISKLHKDAAAEANNKLIGRSSLDIDMKRAAAELGFTSKDDAMSLRTLKPGDFYAFGPAISDSVEVIKIGDVKTTHLRAGERSVSPAPPSAKMKKSLAQLADLPHEAEEEAKTASELRTKVKSLEVELRAAKKNEPKVETKTIEKLVVSDKQLKKIDGILKRSEKLTSFYAKFGREAVDFAKELDAQCKELGKAIASSGMKYDAPPVLKPWPPKSVAPAKTIARPKRDLSENANASDLSKGERVVLAVLVQYPDGVRDEQLGVLTAYKATSRYEFTRSLKAKSYAESRGDRLCATEEGVAAMPSFEPLPTGKELRIWWLGKLSGGEKTVLEHHIAAYPEVVTSDQLQELTIYKGTSIYEFTRKLLARELLVQAGRGQTKASDTLFE